MPFRTIGVFITVFSVLTTGSASLKNVQLHLEPEVVELGQEVIARCDYDLEGEPLFSLKWYRGNHEFYRFSPSENPSIKIFNFTWINVDVKKSNEKQVTIRDIDFHLEGNFSCEITTDAPNFSTASSWRTLFVISSPKRKPRISTESYEYETGEVLRANCSSPPSKPPVKLIFTLNDITVGETDPNRINQEKDTNSLHLNLVLQAFHYVNGQLNLRCIAEIPRAYSETSEVKLRSKRKDPIPEKVTSGSISNVYNIDWMCRTELMMMICLAFRILQIC